MASTQRHKARGDEVVKFSASTAPDALLSIVETCSHAHTHTHTHGGMQGHHTESFTYIQL